jgi:hypothetical protein
MYCQPIKTKEKATKSLPHSENLHQQSVNNVWICILCRLNGDWLQTSINAELAAFKGAT